MVFPLLLCSWPAILGVGMLIYLMVAKCCCRQGDEKERSTKGGARGLRGKARNCVSRLRLPLFLKPKYQAKYSLQGTGQTNGRKNMRIPYIGLMLGCYGVVGADARPHARSMFQCRPQARKEKKRRNCLKTRLFRQPKRRLTCYQNTHLKV